MEDFVVLNNGVRMPRVGLGVYAIPVNQTKDAVLTALSLGYRHIDTAQLYKNEAEVGEAVRASGIPRKEIFVTTKLWGARDYEDAKRSIARSQRVLGIGVIDLLLIHWPGEDNLGVYKALEEAYQAGDVRAIGISNFVENLFPSFIKQVDVVPAVDQVEAHVFCQQKGLRKMMAEAGVVPEAWSPLGSGEHKIFGNPVLESIAKKHQKSVAQIALRFLVQSGFVIIPRTTKATHMQENLDVLTFTLDPDDMTRIESLDNAKSLFGWW